ncbi:hypothetical protein CZ674_06270 [Agrococcus casei LMG 22410]|uniref:Acetone carboxylase n=2 Tax=Agrococcus TaxID=46352 RepID=A0A1R4FS18_9MICO|nr:hypothetical protein CZ674_06270 [Agrococcus casei LMG 22410]
MTMLGFGSTPTYPQCSKTACREEAKWVVNWRNPKIHDADRIKQWAACDDHRDELYDFVAARDFPVSITPFGIEVSEI